MIPEVLEVRPVDCRCLVCGGAVKSVVRHGRRTIAPHRRGPKYSTAAAGCRMSFRRFIDGQTVRLVIATGTATAAVPSGPFFTLTNAEVSFHTVPKPAEPSQWRQKTRPKIK